MGKKETFSFRFDEDRKEDLEKLMNTKKYKSVTSQLENNIKLFKNICSNTERDLRNYFNIFEGQFIIDMFNNILVDYNEKTSVKDYLVEVFELARYTFNENSNINFEKLSEKINQLNDIQAFVIINQIVNYYNNIDEPDIYKLSIIDSDNVYSIDIIYKNIYEDFNGEIEKQVSKMLTDRYVVDNSIKLNNTDIPGYNVISVIFRASECLDLSQKFDLKTEILIELKKISDVVDININNFVYS